MTNHPILYRLRWRSKNWHSAFIRVRDGIVIAAPKMLSHLEGHTLDAVSSAMAREFETFEIRKALVAVG